MAGIHRGGRVVRPYHAGISRRELLGRTAMLGAGGVVGAGLLGACGDNGSGGEDRPLTPSYYDWILSSFPQIKEVSADFSGKVSVKQAPTQGFDVTRFVTEAREGESTWDVYCGQTPFVEMASLVEAEVIEPWDDYVTEDFVNSIIPAIREESTYDGKLYHLPMLVDIVVSAWNTELVAAADLDPEEAPATWDDLLAKAKQVVDSGAAPYGVTFDAHGWRSLVPITHSISTDVYREDGLFNYTSDAAAEALEIMRRMKELANPNVLDPGTTDGGVNDTPDEGAFASQEVAYYVKYQNAPIRFANGWDSPDALALAELPAPEDGDGGTVFWTTGAALFRHGYNKEEAAKYIEHVITDERIWRKSLGDGERVGQLPPLTTTWEEWEQNRPEWLVDWATFLGDQLERARAIQTTKWGVEQFTLGQPEWEKYLNGEVSDPKAALKSAMDVVEQEVERDR